MDKKIEDVKAFAQYIGSKCLVDLSAYHASDIVPLRHKINKVPAVFDHINRLWKDGHRCDQWIGVTISDKNGFEFLSGPEDPPRKCRNFTYTVKPHECTLLLKDPLTLSEKDKERLGVIICRKTGINFNAGYIVARINEMLEYIFYPSHTGDIPEEASEVWQMCWVEILQFMSVRGYCLNTELFNKGGDGIAAAKRIK